MIGLAPLMEGESGCLESMTTEVNTRWSGKGLWEYSKGFNGFGLTSTEVNMTRIDTLLTYELAEK